MANLMLNGKSYTAGDGGANYSYEEQATGLKWVDGKEIYQICFHTTNISMGATIDCSALNVDSVVELRGLLIGTNITTIPYHANDNYFSRIYYITDPSDSAYQNIYFEFGSRTISNYTDTYIIFRYTKSS